MFTGTFSRCIPLQLPQLGLSRNSLLAVRGDHKGYGRFKRIAPGWHRTLLTAVTNSSAILDTHVDTQPSPAFLSSLVDVALSWALQGHKPDDPQSHAIILVHKSLLPSGKHELLQSLTQSPRLWGLNALIGAVDAVGDGAKGVSVLVASRSEGVTIDTLKGIENEVSRVGKWHAKDKEGDEDSMDFEHILASIRGGVVSAVPVESSSNRDFVFVLGEMESVQKQASAINRKYPHADIMGITLAQTPMINSLFTTLVHNGDALPSSHVVLVRIPRKLGEEYFTPVLEHNICLMPGNESATITSCSGNLILELDGQPAMPYLLSKIPPEIEKEKVGPIPLAAIVHCLPQKSGSLYLNVLGGSKSRGGIALDPIVSAGRLSAGTKIEFGQLCQAYLPLVKRPQSGIHIQLEALSHFNWQLRRKCMTRILDRDSRTRIAYRRQRRSGNVPEFTLNERLDYQGIQMGLFSAGSEGGFLIGELGVVPWLCRTGASRTHVQITPYEKGQRRIMPTMSPKHLITIQTQLAKSTRDLSLRNFMGSSVLSKELESTGDRRITVSDLHQEKTTPTDQEFLNSAARRHLRRKRQNNLENTVAPGKKDMQPTTKQYVDPKPLSAHSEAKPSLSPAARWFLRSTIVLMKRNANKNFPGQVFRQGTRRWSFRARQGWSDKRGQFIRSGHRPGGFTLRNDGRLAEWFEGASIKGPRWKKRQGLDKQPPRDSH